MRITSMLAGMGLMLIAAGVQAAQPSSRPTNERPGMYLLDRARQALDDLKLSDEQKAKVDAIFDKARDKVADLRKQLDGSDPRDRMAKIQEFIKSVRDQVAEVLDPKQREEMDRRLDEIRQGMRARMGGNGPTTGPAGRSPGGTGAGPLDRLREALPKIGLSDEQKGQLKDMFDEVRAKGMELKQEAQNGSQEAREKMRELFQETREKLDGVLTTEQKEKLKGLMREGPPPASRPEKVKKSNEQVMAGEKMSGESMGGDMKDGMSSNASERGGDRARRSDSPATPAKLIDLGEQAPSFSLKKTDGALVQLSSLKGRVIVLEFGSYTSPAFRDRAPAMEKLKSEYGTKAQFFVVYGREAHAKGEWEVGRNKDSEISVDQPKSSDARIEQARKAKQELRMTVPILVDTIENDAAKAYGAGENSAFVINRDGTIAAKQEWFDPSGLRRAIDEAVKETPSGKTVE